MEQAPVQSIERNEEAGRLRATSYRMAGRGERVLVKISERAIAEGKTKS